MALNYYILFLYLCFFQVLGFRGKKTKYFFWSADKLTHFLPMFPLKKSLWHRCFPVNFTKFLRTSFLQNTSGRLLLNRTDFVFFCYSFLYSFLNHINPSLPKPRYISFTSDQLSSTWTIKLWYEQEQYLRGCSYGGELARLSELAHLGEISPSLRNSYKNIMCSYEKWTGPPKWDFIWFCRDAS